MGRLAKLKEIGLKLTKIPKTFKAHKTMQRVLEQRRKMVEHDRWLDDVLAGVLGEECQ